MLSLLMLFYAMPAGAGSSTDALLPWARIKGAKALSASERAVARQSLDSLICYRDCDSQSISQCLKSKPENKAALRLANYVVFLAGKGLSVEAVAKIIAKRKASVVPDKVHRISLKGAPRVGGAQAKIEIVEYADFRCPHCAITAQVLDKVAKEFGDRVALTFKVYPLSITGASFICAKAALVAKRLKAFWPMKTLLFAHRGDFDLQSIVALAKRAGIDAQAFRKAMADPEIDRSVKMEIEGNKIEGLRVGVSGTPALFFNGKRYQLRRDEMHLRDRIEEELEILAN